MKPLLFGTFIAITFAITPSWAVNEIRTAKHATIKKHRVARKHKTIKKSVEKIAPTVVTPAAAMDAQPKPLVAPVVVEATPDKMAEPVQVATPNSKPESAAVTPKAPSIPPAEEPATPAPPPVVAVSTPPSKQVNPYLQAIATVPPPAPVMPATAASAATQSVAVTVRPRPPRPVNPYLQAMMARPVIANTPPADFFPPFVAIPSVNSIPVLPTIAAAGNAYGTSPFNNLAAFTTGLMPSGLPSFFSGDPGASHMPISFSMVYPTGDKPLAVLTLKCPTEAAFGVAPPPVKLVHVLLTTAMDGINYTGVLPFNLQQVCQ